MALGNHSYTSAGVFHAVAYSHLTEGDELAFLVVELHVGRCDSVMRSGIKIRYLLRANKFVFSSSVSFYVGGMYVCVRVCVCS